jgi:hypothetical protein
MDLYNIKKYFGSFLILFFAKKYKNPTKIIATGINHKLTTKKNQKKEIKIKPKNIKKLSVTPSGKIGLFKDLKILFSFIYFYYLNLSNTKLINSVEAAIAKITIIHFKVDSHDVLFLP